MTSTLHELRAALAAGPPNPIRRCHRRRRRSRTRNGPQTARRRHRRWLVFAVVVLVVIVAGLIAGFVLWRSTADVVPDFSGLG